MLRQKPAFVSDFETTVFEGQTNTEVWAAAIVPLYSEDVIILHSIGEWLNYVLGLNDNILIYFHNLKFDGEFILSYLLNSSEFSQAYREGEHGIADGDFIEKRFMRANTFRYSISDRGQWYSIIIKYGKHYIEIRDSLKLLPVSVEKIGKSFGTKHHKLTMKYEGVRYAGCEITEDEKRYIANDVLVVKEALEIMFEQGHKKSTIGSCCLAEFKRTSYLDAKETWSKYFPNLYEIKIPESEFNVSNMGEYIRLSYRGGWCYLVKGRENLLFSKGVTADVNSLYPSMMHSESGNRYPIGEPQFWIGNYIPDIAKDNSHYYFVRIKTEFRLKPGKLPCIQIKHDFCYNATDWLFTSDVLSRVDGLYHDTRIDGEGKGIRRTYVILTLTMTDFLLIQEQYDLYNCEILDGCYFEAKVGLFDEYIDKYRKIKTESKGARREVAKLFLNNLYGKMASNTNSSFKYAYLDEGVVRYRDVVQNKKEPGYIPIGSAITSYARNFTIRAAQANYHGLLKPGFIYADTDSIHCNLEPSELKGINVHDSAFCCWKLEATWDRALFVRQKTYLEHVVAENLEPCEPYLNIKCAGMTKDCKQLFQLALNDDTIKRLKTDEDFKKEIIEEYGEIGYEFLLKNPLSLTDFKVGLEIPTGKLLPKHIPGGILLVNSPYKMRPKFIV